MISSIVEYPGIVEYLQTRGLIKQYRKTKALLLSGEYRSVRLAKRKPLSSGLRYRRINKQYRAIAIIQNTTMIVLKIDDHQ